MIVFFCVLLSTKTKLFLSAYGFCRSDPKLWFFAIYCSCFSIIEGSLLYKDQDDPLYKIFFLPCSDDDRDHSIDVPL